MRRLNEEIAALSGKKTVCSQLSAELLRAFEEGTLPAEHIPEVEAHLRHCVACCEALARLPVDTFLIRLRRACENPPSLPLKPSSTPTPKDTLVSSDLPADPTAGEALSLPGFEDMHELGRGGMGVVYAATHSLMRRRVAVKILHPELACSSAASERFRREVRVAARLTHPNIITAYDAGQDGARSFLVMEYVQGESLGEHLSRVGPLPVAEACEAVRQAALGVQHAHENGLIHRDLKPHNLMRTADGIVKVCDFGLAAVVNDRRPAAGVTPPRTFMGTPDYMAPEQAEDARAADGRADVYALGCTLYHLLTGEVPFPDESVLLKLVAHRTKTRPSARRIRPDVPAELDSVLRRAMAQCPRDRFQKPGDLEEALRPFARSIPAPPVRRHRTLFHQRMSLSAIALGLAAIVFAAVGRMWSDPQTGDEQSGSVAAEDNTDREKLKTTQPIHVMKLDVALTRNVKGGGLTAGRIGEAVFNPLEDDAVTVTAWLSRPAYAFLIAFRPDGIAQVCFPTADDQRPPLTDRPSYPFPSAKGTEYGLNDGTGLEAFAVVVSPEPLPPFQSWWKRCGACPWNKGDAPPGIVYRGNGEEAVTAWNKVSEARGRSVEVKGKTRIAELALWLRQQPGITAVRVLGFTVEPKNKSGP